MEDLLALSRRFRRAAAVRFFRLGQCESGRRCCGRRRSASATRPAPRSATRTASSSRCASCHGETGKPVTLQLKLDYAVCEKLCVPVEANGRRCAARRQRLDRCRVRGGRGARAQAGARRRGRPGSAPRQRERAPSLCVFVDLAAPPGEPVRSFVEGPTRNGRCRSRAGAGRAAPGHQHFGFELDGLPPGVEPKGPFDIDASPVVGAVSAIEVTDPSRLIRPAALVCRVQKIQTNARGSTMPIKVGDQIPKRSSA